MTLVNFTKTELQYIEVALYMLSKEKVGEVLHSEESIKNIETILEKVGQLKDVCDCGGKTNWYIIQHKWGGYNVRWWNQNLYNYL